MTPPVNHELDTACLTVDVGAIAANWRALAAKVGSGVEAAAVVKADSYGLGMAAAAPSLVQAGCRSFFVATPGEALALRALAPDVRIFALGGLMGVAGPAFADAGIIPVLNHPGEIADWATLAARLDRRLPAAVHLDTGMNRLGLQRSEVEALAASPDRLDGIDLQLWISHFACADEPGAAMTAAQVALFNRYRAMLPPAPASLSASSGVFCGAECHFDLVRPGYALYGGNPVPGQPAPMTGVVRLDARVLQVRDVDSPMTVGYGATHRIRAKGRIATIAVGYADGYLRSLSGRGQVFFDGVAAPVVGRVSMDLITVDITALPHDAVQPGTWAELIGPNQPVDAVAAAAGTIGYEILTALGARYRRIYR